VEREGDIVGKVVEKSGGTTCKIGKAAHLKTHQKGRGLFHKDLQFENSSASG
jgi:hypothetical protein